MSVKKVCCQGCGADLDVSEGLRYVTCNFCGASLEIIHDRTTTHSRVLEKLEKQSAEMAGDLKVIKLQNELERIDREWAGERANYLVKDKDGHRHEPSVAGSVIGGGVAIVFGVIWMVFAASMGAPGFFPLFGLVFIGFALFGMINSTSKAGKLQNQREQYERKREKVLRELEK